ncbi:MAG: 23S rRNA (guanosine(2251)-2'-O)-methyltransferase RlmB [Gammaproteobacteria bacterium]
MKNISFGLHSSLAAIQQRPFYIQEICLLASRQDKRMQEIKHAASSNNIFSRLVSKDALEKICGDGNHQGVVVVYKEQQNNSEADLLEYCTTATEPLLLLVLDQIVDPHNLGACLRTAEAAGANAVISSSRNSAPLNSTVRKVACGAAERIPLIFAKNLARFLDELKQLGVWVYGTQPTASKLIYQADFMRSVALVIGAEGSGMRRLITEKCDELLVLPMSGEIASLNASVATGIGLFEAVRQRQSS